MKKNLIIFVFFQANLVCQFCPICDVKKQYSTAAMAIVALKNAQNRAH